MQLIKLRICQYRNFAQEEIAPSAGTNLFIGRNGQGKTNLLEAIYMLGYGKSLRGVLPRDCIQHGETECRIDGIVGEQTHEREVGIHISSEGKKLFLHRKPADLEEFVGSLHIIAFTQKHLDIIRGGPAERRSFIDRAMATVVPGHMRRLASYGRILRQRNRLLSEHKEKGAAISDAVVHSWDQTLIREGTGIMQNRLRYLERMKTELPGSLFESDKLKIRYASNVVQEGMNPSEIESRFEQKLLAARKRDASVGFTSIGPHRDDLELAINGRSLADFGSAGQQRSCLLALYFCQMEIHQKQHGFYPIFLLDDVEAELDEQRLEILVSYISGRTQAFLTSARRHPACCIPCESRKYEVEAGKIRCLD